MCAYDIDEDCYVSDAPTRLWRPSDGRCSCGRTPTETEMVTPWGPAIIERSTLCPICKDEHRVKDETHPWGRFMSAVVDAAGRQVECPHCYGNGEIDIETESDGGSGFHCAYCDQLRRYLDHICSGAYWYGQIDEQIEEHWDEDDLYRSLPIGRLIVDSRRGWRRYTPADAASLVDSAIERHMESA